MKVSVIVPIHGVEKYLKRCLTSLLKQSFSYDYEVICVNDTPNDNSPKIIDEFVLLNPKIFKKIDVNNANISFTRNDGLKIAKGEYISFVDGDDFVESNFLSKLYEQIIRDKSDIAVCNYYGFKDKKVKVFTSNFSYKGVCTSKKALKKLNNDISCRGYVWGKLFKRSLIEENNIEFLNVKEVSEDVLFTYMCFLNANKISFTKDRLYFYVLRNDSITSSRNKFHAAQMVINSLALMKLYLLKNSNQSDNLKLSFFSKKFLVAYYIFNAKSEKYTKKQIKKSVKEQFNIIEKDIYRDNMPWKDICKSSRLFNDIEFCKNEKNVDVIDISKI